jgi:K(+)-stimulated pyrophosphate-energized sodium pump
MQGKAKPDYSKAVDISTVAAQKEMVIPGLLPIVVPLAVGLLLGAEAVGALVLGATLVGFILAMQMNTGGAAWDNAKKYIEEGHLGGKGSEAHKASVTGDTVGDPLKDTAGPSLHVLVKLISNVSLTLGPLFILHALF